MSVRDLIDLSGDYPEDMRVVVNGYEEGYDDLSPGQIYVTPIALNMGARDWEGLHGDPDDRPSTSGEAATVVDALVLRRTSN